MPRINLIPWREAQRKQRRQEFIAGSAIALAAAGLITLVVNWQMQSAIDYQNERNTYLKEQIKELDKQIAEILDLEQQKQQLVARMQVIDQLERSRAEVVHLVDELVRTLPDGVYLTSIKQTGRRVQLQGLAQSSTRVSNYMRNIDGSEWLTDPSLGILETRGTGDAGSNFTLTAQQENLQAKAVVEQPPQKPGKAAKGGRK